MFFFFKWVRISPEIDWYHYPYCFSDKMNYYPTILSEYLTILDIFVIGPYALPQCTGVYHTKIGGSKKPRHINSHAMPGLLLLHASNTMGRVVWQAGSCSGGFILSFCSKLWNLNGGLKVIEESGEDSFYFKYLILALKLARACGVPAVVVPA